METETKNALAWGLPLVLLALILRLGLMYISWGSNDATTWEERGWRIVNFGLLRTYAIDRDFNHPPLPGYWSAIAYRLTHQPGAAPAPPSDRRLGITFPFVFKQIDLYLAIGAQRNGHPSVEIIINPYNAISQISFGSRAGTN